MGYKNALTLTLEHTWATIYGLNLILDHTWAYPIRVSSCGLGLGLAHIIWGNSRPYMGYHIWANTNPRPHMGLSY